MKRVFIMISVVVAVVVLAAPVMAAVTVSKAFGDNMVLQRGRPVPIWGWAGPGEEVTVVFGGQKKSVKADKSGRWMVRLDPLKASSKGRALVVQGKQPSAGGKHTFSNVLVGEVWICSGQSNMDYEVAGGRRGKRRLLDKFDGEARYSAIRHLAVPERSAVRGQDDMLTGAAWQVCSPATVSNFTAVGYFFARMIHERTDLPVGLICSAVGGTRIESWTRAEELKNVAGCKSAVDEVVTRGERMKNGAFSMDKEMETWWAKNDPGSAKIPGWRDPAHDVSDWKTMNLPRHWEKVGGKLKNFDGVVWFQRKIDIPTGLAGKDLELSLGPIDDCDTTFFNGVKVGAMRKWNTPRLYKIPGKLVAAGENAIAVRVWDRYGGGGLWGKPRQMSLYPAGKGKKISLAGEWRYKMCLPNSKMSAPPRPMGVHSRENLATGLYNGMIAPLVPYAIRGAIWYQGESNGREGISYMHKTRALAEGWRKVWDQGDFPFYFVQLANFQNPGDKPEGGDGWARIRMAQLKALEIKNTGMAVTIELADQNNPGDVHPENKKDVGERLALWALAKDYGMKITCSGPLYKGMAVKGNEAIVSFDHVGKGLMVGRKTGIEPVKEVKGGALKRFAISGQDGLWHWADAKIEGEVIVVSSPKVSKPVAVRYAYTMNPDGCNLYNKDGLPASPFTTDDRWK